MKKKIALITGIGGQDGSYLAEFLLKKNYKVFGILPRRSNPEFQTYRIEEIINKLNIVYGDILEGESKETDNLNPSSYYSATKASADMLVLSAHRTYGLPYIITRTCNNYGPGQHEEKFIPKVNF